ncbi:hypothetical protein E2N92_00605 [Methanofollis formosanus]|uniref:Uncharacterized protein n=1 Tax=Methanofollis formosanus TaxID=299308 RepID=A0A8G0ZWE6_9EURY|nr:hypothetical protein [Methanofollis formosanus]QYZ78034.1 hypothetical protein E2N92_00605 [Methanofollis formosanus]
MEIHLDNDFVWTGRAGHSGDIGVWYLKNPLGETHYLQEVSEASADVTVPRVDALREGRRALHDAVERHCRRVPEVTEKEVHVRDFEDAFVLYPFWMIGPASSGPAYFALVDGVTGDLVSARVPGNFSWRCVMFAVATGVSILKVAICIYVFNYYISRLETYIPIEILRFAFTLGFISITVLSYAFFSTADTFTFCRYSSEITYGTVDGGYNTSPHPECTEAYPSLPGVIIGFMSMVIGGFILVRSGAWPAAVLAVVGLLVYLRSFSSKFEPEDAGDPIARKYEIAEET